MTSCTTCGHEISANAHGRPRSYCSNACRQKAYRSREIQRRYQQWPRRFDALLDRLNPSCTEEHDEDHRDAA